VRTGHVTRDADRVAGKLTDERVHHFPGRFTCDRCAAARRSTSFSCSSNRIRRFAARSSALCAAVVPAQVPSSTPAAASQFVRHASEIPKSAAMSLSPTGLTVAGDPDHVLTELRGIRPA
jgi:hypothetical protein